MPVDIFGRTPTASSQKVVSGGVTLAQASNAFLRRDGENAATADIDLDSHKITNVLDPTNDQDTATKHYVDGRTFLPHKKLLAPYATNVNTFVWKEFQEIPPGLTESEFDDLSAGLYSCYPGYLPATRLGSLPLSKGYLITLTYQQPVDRNKYYKWIHFNDGKEWEAYFKNGAWNTWTLKSKVLNSGDTMTGDLNMSGNLVKGLPVNYPPVAYDGNEAVSWTQALELITDATTNNTTVPVDDNNLANKKYVDEQNALKVSKSGDEVTGNLLLNVGADLTRTLGCTDVSGAKVFYVLLGSTDNNIQCQLNQPIVIQTSDGLLCKRNSANIMRIGKSATDPRIDVFHDMLMNGRYIAGLHDPGSPQDAATKNYVDNVTKKCYSGHVPILEANVSRLGFVASASSSSPGYEPYGAFNNLNADGANGSWKANTVPGWLQIECPEPIKVWKVALKCRNVHTVEIIGWSISASNDGTNFTTLLNSRIVLSALAPAPLFFIIPSTGTAYRYYRFNLNQADLLEIVKSAVREAVLPEGTVGLQVMQLYALEN